MSFPLLFQLDPQSGEFQRSENGRTQYVIDPLRRRK
jgi:hypothetical protein